ncbi:MAG: V-type ATP synthase subunit C [Clostridiaceae bacterium]|jgi:V/A-type H+-transporting ATPase subunit C|nr:V-type ATP synthase subunit C [Clostridiaceae bacterium]
MLKVNQDSYAYATGLLRARELKLLDKNRIDRMLEATKAEEAYRVLSEAEYGMDNESLKSVSDFEALLAEEMKKTYALLLEIGPHDEVVEVFQKRYDYFNVKVLLKAELSNQDVPPILLDTGLQDRDELVRIIRERDYEQLDQIMQSAIVEVYDVFSRTGDSQVIDLILDKALYHQFYVELKGIKNKFMNELADIIVDITNIKMFIRLKALNKPLEFIKKVLLEGGLIDKELYFNNVEAPIDSFLADIEFTEYGKAIQKSIKSLDNRNIQTLEKVLDDHLMNYMTQQAKQLTIGIEPFIAFLFAKEAEIKNVRIILTGKINGLSNDLIRERLRLVYV